MKHFIKKNTWLTMTNCGWGNGYVIIPQGHFLHGKDYDSIDVEVHGGLTFSEKASDCKDWTDLSEEDKEGWIVGFDTAHLGDTPENCNKEFVERETLYLKAQLESYVEKTGKELTRQQLSRQDHVDNAIHELINAVNPTHLNKHPIAYDIELIGKVRDALQDIFVNDLGACTAQEFYPFIEE